MWLVPLLAATGAFGRTVVRDQKLLGEPEPERAGREAGWNVPGHQACGAVIWRHLPNVGKVCQI